MQGVFFRESTRRKAEEIGGIRGFVRNLPDGTVEVVAEAPPGQLDALHDYVSKGPELARVDRVREAPPPDADLPDGFGVSW